MPTSFSTRNPATGARLATYPLHTSDQTEALLGRAHTAFLANRDTSFEERAAAIARLADVLDDRRDALARLATAEMGKPIAQAEAEVEKCALGCRTVAEHGAAWLADEPVETEAHRSVVAYQPLGVIAAVMPWNFPYWQAVRCAAFAIMAGNTVVLKHAENVLGCGEALADAFAEAGFARGVFQHLITDHDAFEAVIADRRVRGLALTGSERAGRAVAEQAGRHLKPTVLELGGSDAFVVLADADVDAAVETAVDARIQNSGQSCIAAKRFILEAPIAEAFTARFVERMEALTLGDPMDRGSDLGPLARPDLRDELHRQVEQAVSEGARRLTGGTLPDGPGAFYPPTVLADVTGEMLPYREELFGPVAALSTARDAEHALELANATDFGLGGSVFTADRARGEAFARRMVCGNAFVNEMVKSHPLLPFGGVRNSGYGRELGREGARAFTNTKTIWID